MVLVDFLVGEAPDESDDGPDLVLDRHDVPSGEHAFAPLVPEPVPHGDFRLREYLPLGAIPEGIRLYDLAEAALLEVLRVGRVREPEMEVIHEHLIRLDQTFDVGRIGGLAASPFLVFHAEVLAEHFGGGGAVQVFQPHNEVDVRASLVAGEAIIGVVRIQIHGWPSVLVEGAADGG